jgi:predicted alpha/beta hydrolase family esterase
MVRSRLQIIYIPGLGDERVSGQNMAIKTWRLWRVTPTLFQMNWANGEAFAPKLERLLQLIDEKASTGTVSLVAASAGATAAINAYAARTSNITGVVLIAGKVHNPHAISDSFKKRNPAFGQSAYLSQQSLAKLTKDDRSHMLSIRGKSDDWVPAHDSILEDAYNKVVRTTNHFVTIATQLVFGAPSFLRFLKRQDKLHQS